MLLAHVPEGHLVTLQGLGWGRELTEIFQGRNQCDVVSGWDVEKGSGVPGWVSPKLGVRSVRTVSLVFPV